MGIDKTAKAGYMWVSLGICGYLWHAASQTQCCIVKLFYVSSVHTVLLVEPKTVNFSDYHIHVLTSVIKTFFRELPEPLLTFDLYDEFIRASGTLQNVMMMTGTNDDY